MGRDCSKASGNVYFEARKAAAEYDDRLYSREKAAELLGVSVSTLADYRPSRLGRVASTVVQGR